MDTHGLLQLKPHLHRINDQLSGDLNVREVIRFLQGQRFGWWKKWLLVADRVVHQVSNTSGFVLMQMGDVVGWCGEVSRADGDGYGPFRHGQREASRCFDSFRYGPAIGDG